MSTVHGAGLVRRGTARTWWVALRALLLLTAAVIVYTLAVTLVGLAMPSRAHGSLVVADGRVVGSSLIGQSFTDEKGEPLPQWFQSRPSTAGDGYDTSASGASNLGPDSAVLLRTIEQRSAAVRAADGAGAIPPDAVTASGSGLDPDISPAYALLQVDRIAAARGLPAATVRALVERSVQQPQLGFLGMPVVDVLRLNAALAMMDPAGD